MTDTVVLFHNPRCSKSRGALQLLTDRGINPEIINYLENPPSAARVQSLIEQLGIPPMDLVRTGEDDFSKSALTPESPVHEVATAIATYPRLLQRPIVVRGERAVLGRPPENILSLLE